MKESLADPVADGVRKKFVSRYGVWVSAFVLFAGYFGYDTYWDFQGYREDIKKLQTTAEQLKKSTDDFQKKMEEMEGRLAAAQKGLDKATKVADDVEKAQKDIREVQKAIALAEKENFDFVATSAAEIYAATGYRNAAFDFWRRAQAHAEKIWQ